MGPHPRRRSVVLLTTTLALSLLPFATACIAPPPRNQTGGSSPSESESSTTPREVVPEFLSGATPMIPVNMVPRPEYLGSCAWKGQVEIPPPYATVARDGLVLDLLVVGAERFQIREGEHPQATLDLIWPLILKAEVAASGNFYPQKKWELIADHAWISPGEPIQVQNRAAETITFSPLNIDLLGKIPCSELSPWFDRTMFQTYHRAVSIDGWILDTPVYDAPNGDVLFQGRQQQVHVLRKMDTWLEVSSVAPFGFEFRGFVPERSLGEAAPGMFGGFHEIVQATHRTKVETPLLHPERLEPTSLTVAKGVPVHVLARKGKNASIALPGVAPVGTSTLIVSNEVLENYSGPAQPPSP